jgi:hypothetical protein
MGSNVLIIETDGKMYVDTQISLEFLQKQVGGWVQVVDLPAEGNDTESVAMWMNEEGKFSGLDSNSHATELWVRSYGMTDVIMGNVVLTGGTDEDGDTLGLSDSKTLELMKMFALA